nr:unnamed protein product [Callosobruchus analis]
MMLSKSGTASFNTGQLALNRATCASRGFNANAAKSLEFGPYAPGKAIVCLVDMLNYDISTNDHSNDKQIEYLRKIGRLNVTVRLFLYFNVKNVDMPDDVCCKLCVIYGVMYILSKEIKIRNKYYLQSSTSMQTLMLFAGCDDNDDDANEIALSVIIRELSLSSVYNSETDSRVKKYLTYIFLPPLLNPSDVGDCFAIDPSAIQPICEKVAQFADYLVQMFFLTAFAYCDAKASVTAKRNFNMEYFKSQMLVALKTILIKV